MFEKGNIVLVNLNPQRNNEAGKIRPCVIISESVVNETLDLITVIPCTTNILGEGLFRVRLKKRHKLDQECEVMIEQLRAVSKVRIIEKLSCITVDESKNITDGIQALLGI